MSGAAAPERKLLGLGVTHGIAIAPLHWLPASTFHADTASTPDQETGKLRAAIERAVQGLADLAAGVDEHAADILEFQIALCEDEDLLAPIYAAIDSGRNAPTAWRDGIDAEIGEYRSGDDPVFAARADDLADLRDRVLAELQGDRAPAAGPRRPSILAATDLAPSRFLEMSPENVSGIALEQGSVTSHVALLARARGIPMVTGLGAIGSGMSAVPAVLDAKAQCLVLNPTAATLALSENSQSLLLEAQRNADAFIGENVYAGDGRVAISVNIDHVSLLDAVKVEHCDGIGLARTEFIFADGPPDEDTQFAAYAKLVTWAAGRPVAIRTLDAGGDKPVPGLPQPAECNPFLGLRGVRLTLRHPEVFKCQLRALLRAAALGPLKILVPMVTEPSELEAVARLAREAASELQRRGADHAMPPLGMMVEVPAAALCLQAFDAAFYSVGTNDLIQYATAAGRDNASVAAIARGDHPGVTALIELLVAGATASGRALSVCGDMASDPEDAVHLVRLGVRHLSVAPAMLGPVKAALTLAQRGA